MYLWCDNIRTTFVPADRVACACTKHIKIDIHSVQDLMAKKFFSFHHIYVKDQIADIMTKTLASTAFR